MTDRLPIWVFALASLILPGAGQLLQQRTPRGVVQIVLAVLFVATGFLYLALAVYSVWDAYRYEVDLERPETELTESEWRRIQYRQRNLPERMRRDSWERTGAIESGQDSQGPGAA